MKILFVVSDLTYPPVEGLHQQTEILIRLLGKHGHRVSVAGFIKNPATMDVEGFCKETGANIAWPLVSYKGGQVPQGVINRFGGRYIGRQRRGLYSHLVSDSYDVLHLEGAAACGMYSKSLSSKVILSIVDPGSLRQYRMARSARSIASVLQFGGRMILAALFELSLRVGSPIWHVVSTVDRQYLQDLYRHPRVVAIPVTLPYVTASDLTPTKPSSSELSALNILVFCDLRQDYMRTSLAKTMSRWSSTFSKHPGINFTVLGRVPEDAELRSFFVGLSVNFVEWVDDYLSLVRSSDMVLLPDLVGTGLKNRAIQSMALGVPVIGTSVSFEGISVTDGRDAIVLGGEQSASPTLEYALASELKRAKIGTEASRTVVDQFGHDAVLSRWTELYEGM